MNVLAWDKCCINQILWWQLRNSRHTFWGIKGKSCMSLHFKIQLSNFNVWKWLYDRTLPTKRCCLLEPFRQIRGFLPELFRQKRRYLLKPFRQIKSHFPEPLMDLLTSSTVCLAQTGLVSRVLSLFLVNSSGWLA